MTDADKIAALVVAATAYGTLLRLQDKLAADLDRVRSRGDAVVMPSEFKAIDDQHADACDALGDAEHELLICAAVVGGWKREDAEQSV